MRKDCIRRCSSAERAAIERNDEEIERERKRRTEIERSQSKMRALCEETITDDLRMQAISCCAFAQLLEHLVCP